MTTLSIDTPETQEAIERWRQGKINIFDEMARMERERDEAREVLQEIANASNFDNIGNFARNKAREALKIKQ
jgi:nucleoside-triphosphatase THEP1